MAHAYHEIAFTGKVKARQSGNGSRANYARFEDGPARSGELSEAEAAFIALRDSFYIASIGETGWPYLQHRGGPRGFIQALDEHTLGFADYSGNKQYITAGNLDGDDRVSLFFMDYPNRRRLKLFGHAKRVGIDQAPHLAAPYDGTKLAKRIDGAMLINVAAFDWNCPQYITPRFSQEEIAVWAESADD